MGPGHGKALGMRRVVLLRERHAPMATRVVLGVRRRGGGRALNGDSVNAGVGGPHPSRLVVHASVRVETSAVGGVLMRGRGGVSV